MATSFVRIRSTEGTREDAKIQQRYDRLLDAEFEFDSLLCDYWI